jgi:hypothetical protein
MKRVTLFSIALIASYCIVCSVSLLALIRPWDGGSTYFLYQKPDIVQTVLVWSQLPGGIAFLWLMQPSYLEVVLLGLATYLMVTTWRSLAIKGDLTKLRKIGQKTFALFFIAIVLRLLHTWISLPPLEMQTHNYWDIREVSMQLLWSNFESTVILALVFVHAWLRLTKSSRNP